MSAPLVSVVVPVHNYGQYLAESVGSVLAQTVTDFELIIVNDGSTDESAAIARAFDDPRIRYIEHSVNRGLVATLETGFLATAGVFVCRLDADDRYHPDFLEITLPQFERHPEVGLVYGLVAAMDADGRIIEPVWSGMRTREVHAARDFVGDEFLQQVEDNVIPAAAVIGRREAWMRGIPFPSWFTWHTPTDWYLNLVAARHQPVCYLDRILADYRLHSANLHRHTAVSATQEATVFGVLDEMFSGTDRAEAKRAVRKRVYGRAWTAAADRYFAAGMDADARRCYLRALLAQPRRAIDPIFLRHLAASAGGRPLYELGRRLLGR